MLVQRKQGDYDRGSRTGIRGIQKEARSFLNSDCRLKNLKFEISNLKLAWRR
jgi:hypothetical protein